MIRFVILMILSALSACSGGGSGAVSGGGGPRYAGLSCAPFARELSGIALYGDAADWWPAAAGRYRRESQPMVGGVLVLRRSARLPSGHVSVVSAVLGPRQILVMQANWVPEELDADQLVVDVSSANDWSLVRVWYPPVRQLGSFDYAAYGFVQSPRAASHAELEQALQPAAFYAVHNAGRPLPRARGL